MASDEAERIALGKIDIGFIDHQHPASEAPGESVQVVEVGERTARRIGTANYGQLGSVDSESVEGRRENGPQRDYNYPRLLDGREGVPQARLRVPARDAVDTAPR